MGFLLSLSGLIIGRRKAWLIVALDIAPYRVFVVASASAAHRHARTVSAPPTLFFAVAAPAAKVTARWLRQSRPA